MQLQNQSLLGKLFFCFYLFVRFFVIIENHTFFKHTLTPIMSFLSTRRLLENDFNLVKAQLPVPVTEATRNISYKYIVFKANRNDSKEKEKYVWEYLSGGAYKNRCLQIPKERCQTGGNFVYLSFRFYFCISKKGKRERERERERESREALLRQEREQNVVGNDYVFYATRQE